uniref:uncharacterized protein LOC118145682 n=1 Tax=Callithrix jacchus TaxID=9483 RepID=UPI0023DD0DD5|nr:uncharacterized protein LOC118145682 [Callithrix jacchus]
MSLAAHRFTGDRGSELPDCWTLQQVSDSPPPDLGGSQFKEGAPCLMGRPPQMAASLSSPRGLLGACPSVLHMVPPGKSGADPVPPSRLEGLRAGRCVRAPGARTLRRDTTQQPQQAARGQPKTPSGAGRGRAGSGGSKSRQPAQEAQGRARDGAGRRGPDRAGVAPGLAGHRTRREPAPAALDRGPRLQTKEPAGGGSRGGGAAGGMGRGGGASRCHVTARSAL